MIAGFRAAWRGLSSLNARPSFYVVANLVAFLLCIPLITAPIGWAALAYMSLRLQTEPSAGLSDFWDGLRGYWRQGLLIGVVNLLVVGLNLWNLAAYWNTTDTTYALLRGVWFLTLLIWAVLMVYLWPLYFSMKQPELLGALRNAGVMFMLNPGFTLAVLLVQLVATVISSILIVPWGLVTLSAVACIAAAAVLDRLEAAGLRQPPAPPPPDEYPKWDD
jgi:magnesium-transporting ATPase (P-type)